MEGKALLLLSVRVLRNQRFGVLPNPRRQEEAREIAKI
jgi:hypothetical protein